MPDGAPITLGTRELRVVPQGIGRIRRKLVRLMQIGSGEAGEFDGELNDEVYDLLKAFIPDLPPLYELLGYDSQQQMDSGDEPDPIAAQKREATLPQILDAIETVYTVNGADRLVRLGKSVLGGEGLQAFLRREVLTFFSDRSLSSPSTNGGAASTASTTTPQTSAPSAASPSHASSPSSTPESVAA